MRHCLKPCLLLGFHKGRHRGPAQQKRNKSRVKVARSQRQVGLVLSIQCHLTNRSKSRFYILPLVLGFWSLVFALPLSTDYSAQQPQVASGHSSGWHRFGQTALWGNFKSSWTVELTDNCILVQKRKMEIYTDFFHDIYFHELFWRFPSYKSFKVVTDGERGRKKTCA